MIDTSTSSASFSIFIRGRTSLTSPVLAKHPIERSPASSLHSDLGFSVVVFPQFVIFDKVFLDDEFGESLDYLGLHLSALPGSSEDGAHTLVDLLSQV